MSNKITYRFLSVSGLVFCQFFLVPPFPKAQAAIPPPEMLSSDCCCRGGQRDADVRQRFGHPADV